MSDARNTSYESRSYALKTFPGNRARDHFNGSKGVDSFLCEVPCVQAERGTSGNTITVALQIKTRAQLDEVIGALSDAGDWTPLAAPSDDYRVDPTRLLNCCLNPRRVPIRAIGADGKHGTYYVEQLDRDSLVRWLRSRGGDNSFAEEFALQLLGYSPEEGK